MKKKMVLVLLQFMLGMAAFPQSFKPDQSVALQRMLEHDPEIRQGTCQSGFEIMELYYLMTEQRLLRNFPLTGLYNEGAGQPYVLWSRYIDLESYHWVDSIVLKQVRSDGDGLWISLDLFKGSELELAQWDPERKVCTIGMHMPKTGHRDPLKKMRHAAVIVCKHGEDPMDKLKASQRKPMGKWLGEADALRVLGEAYPDEGRPMTLSNVRLYDRGLAPGVAYGEDNFMELLFCTTASKYHHHYGEVSRHDGYILRYFFSVGKWTATYCKDTWTGWNTHEGYVDPSGKNIPVPE